MIIVDGIQYRNLEEQVQKNKEDIARHYEMSRVLQNYGIIIVGSVDAPEQLPDPQTYTGSYGDAYSVGAAAPYSFYVFTRPNQAIGQTENRWLNLGELAIPGPQGPEGEQGVQGPQGNSTRWFSQAGRPAGAGFKNGDQWLDTTTGDVLQYNNNVWTVTGNIAGMQGPVGPRGNPGPQGPEGPQGPQGPAGNPSPVVDILGELQSVDQLPTPGTLPTNAGYLIPIGGVNHLFIIIAGQWTDSGQWGGGATITVGGQVVSNFDADTKLDKVTSVASKQRLYCINTDGTQTTKSIGDSGYDIPVRDASGRIPLPLLPTYNLNDNSAIPKKYVDDLVKSLGVTPIKNTIWEGETTGGTIHLDGRYDQPPFKFTYTLPNELVTHGLKCTIQSTTTMQQSSAGNYGVPLEFPVVALQGEVYKFDVLYNFELGSQFGGSDYIEIVIEVKKLVNNTWENTTDISIIKIEA